MSAKVLGLISKPHLVDLLRCFDRRKWISPRIRYASVRSKPELIADILREFSILKVRKRVCFHPERVHGLPAIEYDLERKQFLFDGTALNVPRVSREKPLFQVLKGPHVVSFESYR